MGRKAKNYWRHSVVKAQIKRDGKEAVAQGWWTLCIRPPSDYAYKGGPWYRVVKTTDKDGADRKGPSVVEQFKVAAGSEARKGLGLESSIVELLDHYIEHGTTEAGGPLKPNTKRNVQQARKHCLYAFEGITVGDIRTATIRVARDKMIHRLNAKGERAIGNATINKYLKYLGTAWAWCVGRELIPDRPLVKPKGLKEIPTRKRPQYGHEQPKVLCWLRDNDPDYYPFHSLLRAVGCRADDCCQMKGDQIGEPICAPSGMIMYPVRYWEQKGAEKELVTIYVDGEVIKLLGEIKPGEYIFKARSVRATKEYISDKTTLRHLRRAAKAVGIVDWQNIDQHGWRRSHASDAPEAGLSINQSKGLLNQHADGTNARYRRLAERNIEESSIMMAELRRKQDAEHARRYSDTYSATGKNAQKAPKTQDLQGRRTPTRYPPNADTTGVTASFPSRCPAMSGSVQHWLDTKAGRTLLKLLEIPENRAAILVMLEQPGLAKWVLDR